METQAKTPPGGGHSSERMIPSFFLYCWNKDVWGTLTTETHVLSPSPATSSKNNGFISHKSRRDGKQHTGLIKSDFQTCKQNCIEARTGRASEHTKMMQEP